MVVVGKTRRLKPKTASGSGKGKGKSAAKQRATRKQSPKRMKTNLDQGTPAAVSEESVKTKIDREWFEGRMRQLGIPKWAPIARQIGIDKSMMTRSLNGERAFTANDICGLATVFQTSVAEIMRRVGYDVPKTGAPIVGSVRDNGKVSTVSAKKGELFEMTDPPPGAEAIVGQMESAELAPYNGVTFVYAASPDNPTPMSAFGQLCVVEADDHLTPYLGTVVKGKERNSIALELFGSKERIELKEIHRVSPVITIHFP